MRGMQSVSLDRVFRSRLITLTAGETERGIVISDRYVEV